MGRKSVKTILYDGAKRFPGLRLLARKVMRGIRSVNYRFRTASVRTEPKTVLFCSYHGKNCSCSPRAVYETMTKDPRFSDYRLIWAVQDGVEVPKDERTAAVPFGGRQFECAMAQAGTWIFNSTLPEHIFPRKNQTYLQCWHGTPLKRLGYDIKSDGNAMNSLTEIHRKYRLEGEKVDFFLSPSPFASKCFRSAWQLERWGKGDAILEVGYPRNDDLVNATEEQRQTIRRRLGIPAGKRALLYTPTFRDDQHESGTGYAYRTAVDFDALRQALGEDYVILFRAHYLVASAFDFSASEGFVRNVAEEDINQLYIASDVLMTDYSSTMFDYAVLRRPILFYMYDLEQYRDHLRGFYFDLNQLPGEILTRREQLIPAIRATEGFVWDERWEAFRQRFAPLDDGHASERVIDAVMRG